MTKIIMDCDPGIDDVAALSVAINNKSLDLELVTTIAGNVTVDKTTSNALQIINFFHKDNDIKVASGASCPLIKPFEDAARIHGSSGMRGYNFKSTVAFNPMKKGAIQALHDYIMNSDEPIILVATGAYTNIALLISEYPEVKANIFKIIAMGEA